MSNANPIMKIAHFARLAGNAIAALTEQGTEDDAIDALFHSGRYNRADAIAAVDLAVCLKDEGEDLSCCETCGIWVGEDYYSAEATNSTGRGICLCHKCCVAMDEDDRFANIKIPTVTVTVVDTRDVDNKIEIAPFTLNPRGS